MDLSKGKKRTIKRRISLFAHVRQENIVFLFLPVKVQERRTLIIGIAAVLSRTEIRSWDRE